MASDLADRGQGVKGLTGVGHAVAGHKVAGQHFAQGRGCGAAGVFGKGAAAGKTAATGHIERAGRVALQANAQLAFLAACIHRRRRRPQGQRVGVQGVGKQVFAGGAFHKLPQVHDGDVIAHVADHAQVVRDEQVGQAQL